MVDVDVSKCDSFWSVLVKALALPCLALPWLQQGVCVSSALGHVVSQVASTHRVKINCYILDTFSLKLDF